MAASGCHPVNGHALSRAAQVLLIRTVLPSAGLSRSRGRREESAFLTSLGESFGGKLRAANARNCPLSRLFLTQNLETRNYKLWLGTCGRN